MNESNKKNEEVIIDLKNALLLFDSSDNDTFFSFKLFFYYCHRIIYFLSIIYISITFILWLAISIYKFQFFNILVASKAAIVFFTMFMFAFIATILTDDLNKEEKKKKDNPKLNQFKNILNHRLYLKESYIKLFNQDFIKLLDLINKIDDHHIKTTIIEKLYFSLDDYPHYYMRFNDFKKDYDIRFNNLNKYINTCLNNKIDLEIKFIDDIIYIKTSEDKIESIDSIKNIDEKMKKLLPIIEFYRQNNVENDLNINCPEYEYILSKYQSYNTISDEKELTQFGYKMDDFYIINNGNIDKINVLIEINEEIKKQKIDDENILNKFKEFQERFKFLNINELRQYQINLLVNISK